MIELITVMAIIALLVGILIPSVGAVRVSVAKTKTKAQFSGYATAYESFKAEYGYYPLMGSSSSTFGLKGSINNEIFIQTLSGRRKDGKDMDNSKAMDANKKRISFYSFAESEFALAGIPGVAEGDIVDAFDNPNIVIIVDDDRDGIIPAGDFGGGLNPAPGDIHAGVVIYVLKNDAADWQQVTSWD